MIYSNYKLVAQGRLGTVKDYSFNPPQVTKEEASVLAAKTEQPEMAESAHYSDPAIFRRSKRPCLSLLPYCIGCPYRGVTERWYCEPPRGCRTSSS